MRLPSVALLTVTLSAATSVAGAQAATQAPLAAQLPAGALLTLDTRNAAPALGRLLGVAQGVLDAADLGEDGPGEMLNGFGAILSDSLGREGVAGVFSVQGKGGAYEPALLAVSRTGPLSGEMVQSLIPKKKGARVGAFPFVRSGDLYAGSAGGLVYVSSDKALLMSYLGRLSGKAAPNLLTSAPYAAARRAAGSTELGLYANFSAAAKVIRSQLAKVMVPRLLSPVVDALDTLGQFAGGLNTTATGLNTVSAQVVNTAGKDRPLARILTDTTDFAVQNVIPGNADAVRASACAPESGAYLGRWLTRVDLIEPLGFLTDSQLASHLERSGAYLGHECAQVTLAGGQNARLDRRDPLAALSASVTYRSVTDQAAAEAHMPEYARSVNEAIAGARGTLKDTLGGLMKESGDLMGGLSEDGAAGAAAMTAGQESLKQLDGALNHLKMVYAFKGGYLITAFSDAALKAALDGSGAPLAQTPAFVAAGLTMQGSGGWAYQPDQPDLKGQDLLGTLPADLKGSGMTETLGPVMDAAAGLINRFDGMTSQRSVVGNVIIGKANVKYRW